MNSTGSVILFSPHWNSPGYVGNLRASRMLRWLSEEGFQVKLIRAGLSDRREKAKFGEIITIRDPLKMHADVSGDGDTGMKVVQMSRKPNALRRWLSYVLLIPDPGIVWARRAMRHPLVLNACTGATWFLASSPPESVLIAASQLASRFGGRFVMDMRDGWLDEPIKPLLRTSALQRWREERLERKMIRNAHSVLVTSNHWKSRLSARYPHAAVKTAVLTNAYPRKTSAFTDNENKSAPESHPGVKRIRFLYAGRIFSSGPGRRIAYLLDPMLTFARTHTQIAEIIFLGDLIPEEEEALKRWNKRFNAVKWEITRIPGKPHNVAVTLMQEVDVLLLLSASNSAIPAKFFDYVSSEKPIFAAAPAGSSVASYGNEIKQFYGYAFEQPDTAHEVFRQLMNDVLSKSVTVTRPEKFEETYLKPKFLSLFQI